MEAYTQSQSMMFMGQEGGSMGFQEQFSSHIGSDVRTDRHSFDGGAPLSYGSLGSQQALQNQASFSAPPQGQLSSSAGSTPLARSTLQARRAQSIPVSVYVDAYGLPSHLSGHMDSAMAAQAQAQAMFMHQAMNGAPMGLGGDTSLLSVQALAAAAAAAATVATAGQAGPYESSVQAAAAQAALLMSELAGLPSGAVSPMDGGPGSPHSSRHSLYKTELCRSWEETGQCRYGTKCQFAHGRDEVKPLMRHPKYKTEVCRTYATTGACPYGTRCRFLHALGSRFGAVSPALMPYGEEPMSYDGSLSPAPLSLHRAASEPIGAADLAHFQALALQPAAMQQQQAHTHSPAAHMHHSMGGMNGPMGGMHMPQMAPAPRVAYPGVHGPSPLGRSQTTAGCGLAGAQEMGMMGMGMGMGMMGMAAAHADLAASAGGSPPLPNSYDTSPPVGSPPDAPLGHRGSLNGSRRLPIFARLNSSGLPADMQAAMFGSACSSPTPLAAAAFAEENSFVSDRRGSMGAALTHL